MYETDQKALYRVYAAFALVLIALGAYVCFCISADGTSTNGLQSDTDREIGATQEQQRQIADEISGVRNANSDAQNAVERAEAAVDRSKNAADQIASSIEDIQRKVAECRKLAERNAAIFDETERANQL